MKVEWTTSELKEMVLVIFAFVWGAILLFPGNTFADQSRIDLLSLYASDSVWSMILMLVSLPMLKPDKSKMLKYRKFAHSFYWIFWFGIATLAFYRSVQNGFQPADYLITSPFITLALMHAIIYIGLSRDP